MVTGASPFTRTDSDKLSRKGQRMALLQVRCLAAGAACWCSQPAPQCIAQLCLPGEHLREQGAWCSGVDGAVVLVYGVTGSPTVLRRAALLELTCCPACVMAPAEDHDAGLQDARVAITGLQGPDRPHAGGRCGMWRHAVLCCIAPCLGCVMRVRPAGAKPVLPPKHVSCSHQLGCSRSCGA